MPLLFNHTIYRYKSNLSLNTGYVIAKRYSGGKPGPNDFKPIIDKCVGIGCSSTRPHMPPRTVTPTQPHVPTNATSTTTTSSVQESSHHTINNNNYMPPKSLTKDTSFIRDQHAHILSSKKVPVETHADTNPTNSEPATSTQDIASSKIDPTTQGTSTQTTTNVSSLDNGTAIPLPVEQLAANTLGYVPVMPNINPQVGSGAALQSILAFIDPLSFVDDALPSDVTPLDNSSASDSNVVTHVHGCDAITATPSVQDVPAIQDAVAEDYLIPSHLSEKYNFYKNHGVLTENEIQALFKEAKKWSKEISDAESLSYVKTKQKLEEALAKAKDSLDKKPYSTMYKKEVDNLTKQLKDLCQKPLKSKNEIEEELVTKEYKQAIQGKMPLYQPHKFPAVFSEPYKLVLSQKKDQAILDEYAKEPIKDKVFTELQYPKANFGSVEAFIIDNNLTTGAETTVIVGVKLRNPESMNEMEKHLHVAKLSIDEEGTIRIILKQMITSSNVTDKETGLPTSTAIGSSSMLSSTNNKTQNVVVHANSIEIADIDDIKICKTGNDYIKDNNCATIIEGLMIVNEKLPIISYRQSINPPYNKENISNTSSQQEPALLEDLSNINHEI